MRTQYPKKNADGLVTVKVEVTEAVMNALIAGESVDVTLTPKAQKPKKRRIRLMLYDRKRGVYYRNPLLTCDKEKAVECALAERDSAKLQ